MDKNLPSGGADIGISSSADPDIKSGNMLFVLDDQGILVKAEFYDKTHLLAAPELFLGKHFSEILPENVAAELKQAVARINKTGMFEAFQYDIEIGGTLKYYECVLTRQSGDSYLALIKDITAATLLHQTNLREKNHFNRILDNINDLVSESDAKGEFTYVSPSHLKILGYSPEELLGRYGYEFLHPDDFRDNMPRLLDLACGTPLQAELRFRHKQGHYVWTEMSCHLETDLNGFPARIIAISRDITEKKLAIDKLQESEQRYKNLVEESPDVIAVFCDGSLVFINQAGVKAYGAASYEEMKGLRPYDFIPEDNWESYKVYLAEFLNSDQKILRKIERLRSKGGNINEYEIVRIKTLFNGRPALHILARSMEEKKKMLLDLEHSENKFRTLFEDSPVGISIAMGDRILNVNKAYLSAFGYSSAPEMIGQSILEHVVPEERDFIMKTISAHKPGDNNTSHYDFNGLRKDGSKFPIHVAVDYIRIHDGEASIAFVIDMTESRQREEKIRQALREKEILLKEVHHRVKNNLQIITSLLSLQSDFLSTGNFIDAFNDTTNRIRSMALIHERLYRSENFASIDFGEYIMDLVSWLRKTYRQEDNIKFEVDFDMTFLELDTAIPCGLILNELTSNAFKYAFTDSRPGEFTITMKKESSQVTIQVKDNGPGIPEEKLAEGGATLGLTLVHSLVQQLKGTLQISSSNGAEFIIRFPYAG